MSAAWLAAAVSASEQARAWQWSEADRALVTDREAKSVSAEETFSTDLTDRAWIGQETDLLAARVGGRLRGAGLSGRTVTVKIRHHDFTTITRSVTRDQPTDDPRLIAHLVRGMVNDVDTSAGIRLLGVGVTTLTEFAQDDLFTAAHLTEDATSTPDADARRLRIRLGRNRTAPPGVRDRTSTTNCMAQAGSGAVVSAGSPSGSKAPPRPPARSAPSPPPTLSCALPIRPTVPLAPFSGAVAAASTANRRAPARSHHATVERPPARRLHRRSRR